MDSLAFAQATDAPFQNIGAAHYFDPIARSGAESIGLDLFRFYFCGRGGVLGSVDSSVVQSAFGYFNPELLHKMWSTGGERCDVETAAATQLQVAYDIGARDLDGLEGLQSATQALVEVTSSIDSAALGLFAGFQRWELPTDPVAAWMHQVIVMRELRGSVHLAALGAHGVPGRIAHQIKRPNDGEMFGWPEPTEITDQLRQSYEDSQALTDATMASHLAQVPEEAREHVLQVATEAAERIAPPKGA